MKMIDNLLKMNNSKSNYTLNSLNRTLDYFNVNHNREIIGDALLKLAVLKNSMIINPLDRKTKLFLEMLRHFKMEIGVN